MKRYKVFLDSAEIRCRPNKLGVSSIYKYLIKNGHEFVKDPSVADYIIVNTCGFDELRRKVTLRLFTRYKQLKRPETTLISVGCLNKINKPLVESIPDIKVIHDLNDLDTIFCNENKFYDGREAYFTDKTAERLGIEQKSLYKYQDVLYFKLLKPILKGLPEVTELFEVYSHRNKFFVEISEGCTFNCSYCIIKKAKGDVKSRSSEYILRDIRSAYEVGKKLVLVADDCGSYGADIGSSLPELIENINDEFPGLRIEITYLNPTWLRRQAKDYIRMFKKADISLVNIPLQSGSNRILKRMNRFYNIHEVIELMKRIKEVSSTTVIWTHVIIGFPGENFADFIRTMLLTKYVGCIVCFRYSDRQGTASTFMHGKNSRFILNFKYAISLAVSHLDVGHEILKAVFRRALKR